MDRSYCGAQFAQVEIFEVESDSLATTDASWAPSPLVTESWQGTIRRDPRIISPSVAHS